jgi:hypothetical protein
MKTFQQYLAESTQTHDYRIKFVGTVPADFVKSFRKQLEKFDPVSMGDVRTTPVMSQPQDFPSFANESVSMIDVSFRYPATQPQIAQIAKLLGLDEDRLCVKQRDYAEGIDRELVGIEQQKDLLTSDYPSNTKQQQDLKNDYAAVGVDKQVVKNSAADATWTVAGGRTAPAVTTNDLPQGVRSPMSSMKRPPRPETGFKK